MPLPWDGEPCEVARWRTDQMHPDRHGTRQCALYALLSTWRSPGSLNR